MARPTVQPTGIEKTWNANDIIVSKTDTKGIITYANDTFLSVAEYSEQEALGANHNMIRHPDMPRCVFGLLWSEIATGKEIFAYVKNMTKKGDHYWVFAHVTPTFGKDGKIIGYHSNRRVPKRDAVETCSGLYQALLEEERRHKSPKDALAASTAMVVSLLKDKGLAYDEFVLSI